MADNYPRFFRGQKMTSENESRLRRLLEERADLVNCALDFKYFDVPQIWPRMPLDVASTNYTNIYDRLSLGVQIFSSLNAAARYTMFRRFSFFFHIKIKLNEPRDERRMARMKNHRSPSREERILRMLLRSSCWNRKSFRAAAEFCEVLRDATWLLA